jgi:hypothetical protein
MVAAALEAQRANDSTQAYVSRVAAEQEQEKLRDEAILSNLDARTVNVA